MNHLNMKDIKGKIYFIDKEINRYMYTIVLGNVLDFELISIFLIKRLIAPISKGNVRK